MGTIYRIMTHTINASVNNISHPSRKVGILLGLGILFMPYIFSWFTLRQGYSKLVRSVSIGWMIFGFLLYFFLGSQNNVSPQAPTSSSSTATQELVNNNDVDTLKDKKLKKKLALKSEDKLETINVEGLEYYEVTRSKGKIQYYDMSGILVDSPYESSKDAKSIDSRQNEAVDEKTTAEQHETKSSFFPKASARWEQEVYTNGNRVDTLTVVSESDLLNVKDVLINRGNCNAILVEGQSPLKFGESLKYTTTCDARNIKEVKVVLENGKEVELTSEP